METFEWAENIPVTANNLNAMQTILGGNFIMKGTVLWTNPNPNADFAAQNITLSSSDYDYYEVFFRTVITGNLCFSAKALKGYGTQLSFNSAAISARHWVRRILYTNDTTLSSQECAKLDDAYTADNGQCVPLLIIGYKY